MFFTASHCREIEVELFFVTDRFTGVGSKEPSPVIVEDKGFTLVKNLQLSRQLLEVFFNRKQTRSEHSDFPIRKVKEREIEESIDEHNCK